MTQAVTKVRGHTPHIVFLDLDMPVLDGYGAVRAIRAANDAGPPFVVALTGQSGPEVERLTAEAGFDFYMQKPATTNALLALVDDLSQRRR